LGGFVGDFGGGGKELRVIFYGPFPVEIAALYLAAIEFDIGQYLGRRGLVRVIVIRLHYSTQVFYDLEIHRGVSGVEGSDGIFVSGGVGALNIMDLVPGTIDDLV